MAQNDPDISVNAGPRRLRGVPSLAVAAGLLSLAVGLAWVERIDIAQRLIDRQIQQLKLSARYRIDAIGPGTEVLSDVSVGDAAKPDLTIARLEIYTGWSGALPAITGLKLVGARLHGTYVDGHLSFGSLDRWLVTSREAFRLPDIALSLRDFRVGIAGPRPMGIAVDGSGNLRDGFAGTAAMAAPALQAGGCVGNAAQFAGQLAIHDEQPRVIGPLRMAHLACAASGLTLDAPDLKFDMLLAPALTGGTARLVLTTGAARWSHESAARLTGSGDGSLHNGVLAANFGISAEKVSAPSAGAAQFGIAGHLRADLQHINVQGDGTLSGRGIAPDPAWVALLARAQANSAGTFAAPLLADLRAGLARETAASKFSGTWILRHSVQGTTLDVPQANLDGAQTARWVSLNRVMLQQAGDGKLALAGDFALTGRGFPQLRGQITTLANGAGDARLAMASWIAGTTSLAMPGLAVHWTGKGGVGFASSVILSGPVPGGNVTGLRMPLEGNWSPTIGLRLGNHCTALSFDRVSLGTLTLGMAGNRQPLTLCPAASGGAIVALDGRGPRVAMRSAGLKLAGRINGSAVNIATGPMALNWPGGFLASNFDVAMANSTPSLGAAKSAGAAGQAAHVHIAQLTASLGAVTSGQFTGGEVSMAGTPAALRDASGDFHWANGRLTVNRAVFRVEDPATTPVFAPILVNDATVSLANGVVSATASLRTSAAQRALAQIAIVHDLASSTGHADVRVPGLVFDKALQPKQLSPLAEGVIADARGILLGNGRFDWNHGHVTSHGWLSTASFDFAAPFGPVKGVSGKVEFSDLIGLVTAPDQSLAIASINPGIEVDDGILNFAVQPGHVLVINGAHWPFLDGTLALLPTRLVLGATELRRYELRVDGLNAAKFLARMDLSNLAATGIFDGNLPLIFDQNGGRIEKGLLLSRTPGGTVSYVGDLTYKDLSPMANYAFQALRSLTYRQMRIAMDGALAGDIVTHVTMQGVGQGPGAKRNLITNQIARLPIRFDVTITAPFMQLITSFRSLYDPALVPDPRTLGLIDAHGRPIANPSASNLPPAKTPPVAQRAIQP
ncbi:MAG: YdbH domain-containing protein [Pseudomonadota bacterium]|nr:YdbH domain-containing protein [Pseudomonadota bacterium]